MGVTFRNAWTNAVNYAANDIVTHNGEAWIALASNTNYEPTPANAAIWAKLAAKGDPGRRVCKACRVRSVCRAWRARRVLKGRRAIRVWWDRKAPWVRQGWPGPQVSRE